MRAYFALLIALGVLAMFIAPAPGQTNSKNIFDDGSGTSQPAENGQAQRAAVPDSGAVAAAMTKVEATYAEDLKNSVKPQDKVFLSQKLQLLAGDDRDNAHCYAMLAKAKDLAIAGGSFEQAASVIDLIGERFDVDGPALKWEAVQEVAGTAGKDQQAELRAGVVKLANDALGVDRYDIALLAAQWCMDRSHGDVASQSLVDQVRETQNAYEAIKPALAALASDPHNSDANTAVGKFKCFFKGDWNGGLAMLAAGSDAGLKGLASDELNGATTAAVMAKLGDGWWDVAQQQSGIAKDRIQLHAAAIYAEASEGLGGLDKAKADGRVQEAMALHAKMTGTTAPAAPAANSGGGSGPAPSPNLVTGPGPAPDNTSETTHLTNSVGMKLVWISPGKFTMGSPPNEPNRKDNEPLHQVTITKGFYVAEKTVTQAQWNAVEQSNPSHFHGDDLPVDSVSWDAAVDYCKALGIREKKHYRLPTDAEWEYACRAGTTTAYYFGNNEKPAEKYMWLSLGSHKTTHAVGQKRPNPWGLCDMGGNVWNWCQDGFDPLSANPATDPCTADEGHGHVIRGGSWKQVRSGCRSARRDAGTDARDDIGFRVVMDGE